MSGTNTLAAAVWSQVQCGNVVRLEIANTEITQIYLERECHRNVGRWVQEHPGHRAVAGWLVTGVGILVLHSVVDTGLALLDITPRPGTDGHRFLDFIPWPGPIEGLPPQLIWAG